MKWHLRLIQELLVSVALGSLPVFISYWYGGIQLTVQLFRNVMPEAHTMWYLIGLTIPYALVSYIDWLYLKRTYRQRLIISFLRSTWREIGTALHGLWRVLAGCLLSAPILWAAAEPQTLTWAAAWKCLWIGTLLLIECCFFSKGIELLEAKGKRLNSIFS